MAISTIGTNALGASAVALATQTSGVLPATALPAGSVIQVVQGTPLTTTVSTGTTYVTTGCSVTITPQFSNSKILITLSGGNLDAVTANSQPALFIYKNGTNITPNGIASIYAPSSRLITNVPIVYLDSPATTSATTYTLWLANINTSSSINFNNQTSYAALIAQEIR